MSAVALAPVRKADAQELIRANLANRAYHHPWARPFVDQAGFDTWLAKTVSGPNVGLIARETTSGAIVGVVSLNEIIGGLFQNAYLGFYGMSAFGGRGLMTDAVRQATRYAFDDLGLHRLEANIQPGNSRSIGLVRRLGFRMEGFSPDYLFISGEWRDHERWSLLSTDLVD